MSYCLNIKIDALGRTKLLNNNEKIVIVSPEKGGLYYSVACVCFSPFGDSNLVEFQDDWIEYASSQKANYLDVINMNIHQQVHRGNRYVFDGVHFIYGDKAFSNKVYGLTNKSKSTNSLFFGLGQKIKVLSNSNYEPLNITDIPNNMTAYFKDNTILWIFIASGVSLKMILPTQMLKPISMNRNDDREKNNKSLGIPIIGDYLQIDLKHTSTVTFDNSINAFRI